jgi:hypothetical protein
VAQPSRRRVAQPSRRFRTSGRPTLSFLEGRGFDIALEWRAADPLAFKRPCFVQFSFYIPSPFMGGRVDKIAIAGGLFFT